MSFRGTVAIIFTVAMVEICFSHCSQVYVVYMGRRTGSDPGEILERNHQVLASVHDGSLEKARAAHVYSYKHGFSGFAAKLTEGQASLLSKMPGVVSVFPNQKRNLHTTHSWDFMGLLSDEAMEVPGFSTRNQDNVIIGFIDTGLWPESPSFSDSQMPPVPPRWKGHCQEGEAFNSSICNRKVIGARYYFSGFEAEEGAHTIKHDLDKPQNYNSARDASGHGSHTASIAAGRYVWNMNFNGLGAGGARGGAPLARIAVYKSCWDSGCYDADLLAAFDDAIKDGVDIVSLSLGPNYPQGGYFLDAISIGSFHAVTHGIPVVTSVGNEAVQGSATNIAPWMITVAAGATDRDFTSNIVLGDGRVIEGESICVQSMNAPAMVMSASDAFAGYFTPYQASYCLDSSLNSSKVSGKVLVCRHADSSADSKLAKSVVVKAAGGVGMILVDEQDKDVAIPFVIPAATVGTKAGNMILSYINNTSNPKSLILPPKTVLGSKRAPRVAAFSSKGPSSLSPQILKPDITAPGLNILAAWSPADKNKTFNILSGTSMACPHVTGIAALVKAVHPLWSPTAIKSAIMTTATVIDKDGNFITVDPEGRVANPFDYGAGFVNPMRVLNPGLLYDASAADYRTFLCSLGYDQRTVRLVTGDNSSCPSPGVSSNFDLNYPSIAIPNLKTKQSVTRTVTNVGKPVSVYRAIVSPPPGIEVTVVPRFLNFSSWGQKMRFTVTFKVVAPTNGYVFGSLTWRKRHVQVHSPLVVRRTKALL
ncbi:CO(2)-response secreted protease [Nymphaea thermarum]|nr:CO(2)-response secreted protease [Nymphaea thermarum]